MKKFTLLAIAALISVVAFAQKPNQFLKSKPIPFEQTQLKAKAVSRQATVRKAPHRSMGLITPPETAVAETYYTASGKLLVNGSNGWEDSGTESVQVIVDGTDIYIAGLAYFANKAWIKGTISGATATFPASQQVDDDESYPEWISGSNDGQTICDVVFNFDQETGVLECTTKYIGECAVEDAFSIYAYWTQPTFTKEQPAGPEVVEVPDGLETEEYVLTARNYKNDADVSVSVQIGFDGNDVYIQGLSTWITEAWVKGTLNDATITFASGQYFGNYANYDMFLNTLVGEDVIFDYDAEAGTLTAQNTFFLVDNSSNYFDSYRGAVLKKVVEKAAMPANPEIKGLEESNYGYVVEFNVPLLDINGEPLVASKLSYIIYADTKGTIAPLTFTSETHSRLTEEMTEIPYGFTDNYDIYSTYIYLNDLYSADWTRLGIQSIYRGGDEENKTEIQWFDILPEPEAIEAPEGLETESYLFSAIDVYNDTNAARKVEGEESKMYTYQMQVGFDGNDVYFKGVSDDTADMWLKGTLSQDGKTVTIPANQFMGQIDFYGYFTYDYFFAALGEDYETLEDIVLNYNAETSTFTTDQTLVLHDGKRSLGEPYQMFTDVVISKMVEFAATPADPSIDSYKLEGTSYPYISFEIPAKDVDGHDIITSKLFYTVWIEWDAVEQPFVVRADKYRDVTEDMTEIPYDWDDGYDIYIGGSRFYINPAKNAYAYTKYGIQSIYYGGDERNTSNIVWMENPVYDPVLTDAITDVNFNNQKVVIFDLQGRRVSKAGKGLYIVNGKKMVK